LFMMTFLILLMMSSDIWPRRNASESGALIAWRTIVDPKIKTERADGLEWDYTAFLYPWNDAYRWSGVSYPRD
jgi:hypothetical protein